MSGHRPGASSGRSCAASSGPDACGPASALAVAAALPGGDPLAAALAAGETPSPEMVAAAGSNETDGAEAGDFAADRRAGEPGGRLVADAAAAHAHAGAAASSPQELQVRARDLARGLGYGTATADSEASIRLRPHLSRLRRRTADAESTHRVRGAWRHAVTVLLHLRGRARIFHSSDRRHRHPLQRTPSLARANGLVSIDLGLDGRLRRFLGNPTRTVAAGHRRSAARTGTSCSAPQVSTAPRLRRRLPLARTSQPTPSAAWRGRVSLVKASSRGHRGGQPARPGDASSRSSFHGAPRGFSISAASANPCFQQNGDVHQ